MYIFQRLSYTSWKLTPHPEVMTMLFQGQQLVMLQ